MKVRANRSTEHPAAPACTMRIALVLPLLLFAMPLAQSGPARQFDVTSLGQGQMWQARMLARTKPEPGCTAQYGLSALEGEGEHTVYQAVEMPGEVVFRLRMRAALRHGVQLGFASHDWSSFSLASISLLSGAHVVSEGGSLKAVRLTATPRPDGWVEISFNVANQSRAASGGTTMGFAFVKLTADEGAKDYRGRPGHGVELCAISQ